MKTPIRATVAAALLTVLAGCASAQSASSASPVGNGGSAPAGAPSDGASTSPGSTGEGTPTAPTPASPPTTAGGNGGGQVPLPPVHSTAANGDRITYVSPDGITTADGGRTLTTSVEWGGCQEQPQLVVFGQDAHQVVVEVKTVTHFKLGQMCPNIERTGTVKASLSAPLAGRELIDGVTGRPVTTG